MSKLNKTSPARRAGAHTAHAPVQTSRVQTGFTALGGAGFGRDPQSELYLLGVTNMVSEKTFHEMASVRDSRYNQLVRHLAVTDPEWTIEFLTWLRFGAGMRSAPIVGAVEFVMARLTANAVDNKHAEAHLNGIAYAPKGINRRAIDAVLARPDEVADLINYAISTYGRNLPMAIKRGAADAATRMYNEWSLLRYDSDGDAVRMADVLELTHPVPNGELVKISHGEGKRRFADKQGVLFKHAIDRRHNRVSELSQEALPMVYSNTALKSAMSALPEVSKGTSRVILEQLLSTDRIKAAGLSWQNVLSMAGNKLPKDKLWEAVIPTMGYQALLMNLRNFDQAGVSDAVAADVVARLSDPYQVARSRMMPMQFLSAYRATTSSLRWGQALNTALELSLGNIPRLAGKTLILIDTSYSMNGGFSKDGTLARWDAAAIFGLALAKRCENADVVSFSSHSVVFPAIKGEALLKSLERFKSGGYFIGNGTETGNAVRTHAKGHVRIVVLTDEQAASDGEAVFNSIPPMVPTYTWNLAGYRMGHAAGSPNRHTFGGLTDDAFKMIPLLEAGKSGTWPWENQAAA